MSRRHDREPSRIPVKKMKRLLQKSKKLRIFLWKRILKIAPLLSQLHGYISCRLRSQTKRRRIIIGLRFVQKVKKDPVEVVGEPSTTAFIRREFRQTMPLTLSGK